MTALAFWVTYITISLAWFFVVYTRVVRFLEDDNASWSSKGLSVEDHAMAVFAGLLLGFLWWITIPMVALGFAAYRLRRALIVVAERHEQEGHHEHIHGREDR